MHNILVERVNNKKKRYYFIIAKGKMKEIFNTELVEETLLLNKKKIKKKYFRIFHIYIYESVILLQM